MNIINIGLELKETKIEFNELPEALKEYFQHISDQEEMTIRYISEFGAIFRIYSDSIGKFSILHLDTSIKDAEVQRIEIIPELLGLMIDKSEVLSNVFPVRRKNFQH